MSVRAYSEGSVLAIRNGSRPTTKPLFKPSFLRYTLAQI